MDDGHFERLHDRPLGFVVVGILGQSASVRVMLPKRMETEMIRRQWRLEGWKKLSFLKG